MANITKTYEDIRKANEAIETTPIKGKNYAEVNQRIKAFRMVYPQGYIITEMLSNENGICIFKATVGEILLNGEPNTLGVGHAYEKEGSTFINKTSYIENCETSAVGRALGMAGFGIDTSVTSAEEVGNAIAQQDAQKSAEIAKQKIDEIKARALADRCVKESIKAETICKLYKVEILKDLTEEQFRNINDHWSEIKKAQEEM